MSADSKLTILLVGDSGVGKTSIQMRYTEGAFSEESVHPEDPFKSRSITTSSGKPVILRLKDTQGFENFRGLTSSYCRGAKAILFIFDVTNRETLTGITSWVAECARYGHVPVQALIGNKIDLTNRTVTSDEAKKLAAQHRLEYFEVSAKTSANLDETFKQIASLIVARGDDSGDEPPSNQISLITAKQAGRAGAAGAQSGDEKCIIS